MYVATEIRPYILCLLLMTIYKPKASLFSFSRETIGTILPVKNLIRYDDTTAPWKRRTKRLASRKTKRKPFQTSLPYLGRRNNIPRYTFGF